MFTSWNSSVEVGNTSADKGYQKLIYILWNQQNGEFTRKVKLSSVIDCNHRLEHCISLIKFARKKEVRIQWSKERRKDAMEQGKERKK